MSSKINIDKIIDNERKNMFLPLKYNLPNVKDYNKNNQSDKVCGGVLFDKKIFYNSNIKVDGEV